MFYNICGQDIPWRRVISQKISRYKRGKKYPVSLYLSKKQEYENLRNSNNTQTAAYRW